MRLKNTKISLADNAESLTNLQMLTRMKPLQVISTSFQLLEGFQSNLQLTTQEDPLPLHSFS